ncbi:MAG: DUF305 domain-containing protein [Gemmatimonadaceae bacterium]
MPTLRSAAFLTAAILALAPSSRVFCQAPVTGVEQARIDSLRRPYTAADIEFMSGMIGHHSQAVKMAGWCASHGANKSLQTFCGRIALGQTTEIGLMSNWLKDRNQAVPAPDPRGMEMMMNGKETFMMMPGMLTEDQMKQLDAARGTEFDRLFLTYMIQHHKGAITMVDTLDDTPGADQDEFVFKFSNDVQADQTTEIARMQQMLDALPPTTRNPQ